MPCTAAGSSGSKDTVLIAKFVIPSATGLGAAGAVVVIRRVVARPVVSIKITTRIEVDAVLRTGHKVLFYRILTPVHINVVLKVIPNRIILNNAAVGKIYPSV